jgi:hypothetical protein
MKRPCAALLRRRELLNHAQLRYAPTLSQSTAKEFPAIRARPDLITSLNDKDLARRNTHFGKLRTAKGRTAPILARNVGHAAFIHQLFHESH